jgi:hypothetical protein
MTREPHEFLDQIFSPGDLAQFVNVLRRSLIESPDTWENLTLSDFLESMSAWLDDASRSEGPIAHAILSSGPSWRTFANILLAASAYE